MSRISALLSQLCCSVTTTYSSCAPGTTTVALHRMRYWYRSRWCGLPAGLQAYRKRPPDHQRPYRTLCGLSRSVLGRKHAQLLEIQFSSATAETGSTVSAESAYACTACQQEKDHHSRHANRNRLFHGIVSSSYCVYHCRGVRGFVASFRIRMSRPRNCTGLKYFQKSLDHLKPYYSAGCARLCLPAATSRYMPSVWGWILPTLCRWFV